MARVDWGGKGRVIITVINKVKRLARKCSVLVTLQEKSIEHQHA
jgi:hypothetical protein